LTILAENEERVMLFGMGRGKASMEPIEKREFKK
jgi:hypothetical protein